MSTQKLDIAPGISASRWQGLELNEQTSAGWDEAIGIFKARINERYIEPVQVLLNMEEVKAASKRKYGFTILAINCLLVETLWAFKGGLTDTKSKSQKAFTEFLQSEEEFKFTESQAKRFYLDFRCGILHQAEICGQSKVWSVGQLVSNQSNGGLTINRTKFHSRLVACYDRYCNQLADDSEINLRKNFITKMNYICRIDHHAS